MPAKLQISGTQLKAAPFARIPTGAVPYGQAAGAVAVGQAAGAVAYGQAAGGVAYPPDSLLVSLRGINYEGDSNGYPQQYSFNSSTGVYDYDPVTGFLRITDGTTPFFASLAPQVPTTWLTCPVAIYGAGGNIPTIVGIVTANPSNSVAVLDKHYPLPPALSSYTAFGISDTYGKAYGLNAGTVVPGGTAFNGPLWRAFNFDKRDVARIASWGINAIRVHLDYYLWGGTDATQAQAIAAFAVWDTIFGWFQEHGIWVEPCLSVPPGGSQSGYVSNFHFWGTAPVWRSAADNSTWMQTLRDFWVMFVSHYAPGGARPDLRSAIYGINLINEPSFELVGQSGIGNYFGWVCDQCKAVDPTMLYIIDCGAGQTFPTGSMYNLIVNRPDTIAAEHPYGYGSHSGVGAGTGPFRPYPGPTPDADTTIPDGYLFGSFTAGAVPPFTIDIRGITVPSTYWPLDRDSSFDGNPSRRYSWIPTTSPPSSLASFPRSSSRVCTAAI